MRAYQIIITDTSYPPRVVKTWQSHPQGKFDPGALNIEFDAIVSDSSSPIEGQAIKIHGISLSDLSQAQEFTGLQLALYGGMQSGLPLATPSQYGLLVFGKIWQSWGTWEGTEMNLNFILQADDFFIGNPGNITLNWPMNTPLAPALSNTLSIAYPKIPIVGLGANGVTNIANIVQNNPGNKTSASLSEFRSWLLKLTAYLGHPVQIALQGGKFNVYDDTYKPKPINILFSDLIGQPTWVLPYVMQVMVILRSDVILGSRIMMPIGLQNAPGQVITMGQSFPSSEKYKATFQGEFFVKQMRHIGNYKAKDGQSWATLIECTPTDINAAIVRANGGFGIE